MSSRYGRGVLIGNWNEDRAAESNPALPKLDYATVQRSSFSTPIVETECIVPTSMIATAKLAETPGDVLKLPSHVVDNSSRAGQPTHVLFGKSGNGVENMSTYTISSKGGINVPPGPSKTLLEKKKEAWASENMANRRNAELKTTHNDHFVHVNAEHSDTSFRRKAVITNEFQGASMNVDYF